jgi:acyl-CoA synthetase (AMP-forming)/AMP-acid ligase II
MAEVVQEGDPRAMAMLSAGGPIEGVEVRVLDASGQPLPERNVGEIALRSNCMLTGYYHRPDLTSKAFLEGWYLTGDLGYLADGELFVSGRKKDMIIVGGKNVYPQDLERLAGEAEGVHPGRVVAFGVFDPQAGTEEVVVVAELEPDTLAQESRFEAVAADIRRRVTQGSEVVLRTVYLVEGNWLLKTSSGKIARAANREKYLQAIRQDST